MTVYLFNPENDLALGLDAEHYTPRPNVARYKREMSRLLLVLGQKGDTVLGDDVDWERVDKVQPWGWSRDAKRQFKDKNCPDRLLPDDVTLKQYRELSHRATSIQLLQILKPDFALPQVCDHSERALSLINDWGECYLKSPWSGSGKGVIATSQLNPATLKRHVCGIIHRQGSIIIEPARNKKLDFATLWEINRGEAQFRGYSVFTTGNEGVYKENLALPQRELYEIITQACSAHELEHWIRALQSALSEIYHDYSGPLGVDMMVVSSRKIMPCIEVNLRLTMGFIAMAKAEKSQLKP